MHGALPNFPVQKKLGEKVKMTKIVLEHLAFLGSLAYVVKEGSRVHLV